MLEPAMLAEQALEAIHSFRLDEAEQLLQRVLQEIPEHPDATHHLGILRHRQGLGDAGIALLRKAIDLAPDTQDWHNDLGNMLAAAGRNEEAIAAFMAALQLDTGNPVVWNNLGAVLLRGGLIEDAKLTFENAITLDPGFEDALNNLGNALTLLGRTEEAARCFCTAYIQRPGPEKPKQMLGIAYYTLGMTAEAAQVYRSWLQEEPGNAIAGHMLSACSGLEVPERASNAYIEAHFDEYAETFESKLVDSLSYRIPEEIGRILGDLDLPAKTLKVLDAGCGTGLCGPHLAPFAKTLVGVDLSARSLALAAEKQVYDVLDKAELVDYLSSMAGTFDLIVIADTLIYFGKLENLLQAAAGALCHGGLLIASVEELAPSHGDFALNPSGRYSHSRAYLANALMAAGFEAPEIAAVDVRMERGISVKGLLIVVRTRG